MLFAENKHHFCFYEGWVEYLVERRGDQIMVRGVRIGTRKASVLLGDLPRETFASHAIPALRAYLLLGAGTYERLIRGG